MTVAVLLGIALGAALGSFGALAASRVPRGLSVVRPGSRCDACGAAVRPWDNVPIVAWLRLRGRCAACGARIPASSLLWELGGAAAGGAGAALAWRALGGP